MEKKEKEKEMDFLSRFITRRFVPLAVESRSLGDPSPTIRARLNQEHWRVEENAMSGTCNNCRVDVQRRLHPLCLSLPLSVSLK